MDRTAVRRADEPRGKKPIGGPLIAAIAVVLLFSLVGVVSAASFVANKFSGSSAPAAKKTPVPTAATAAEIAQAHVEATAIVKNAQSAGRTIVATATSKAHRQASSIAAKASRSAQRTRTAPVAPPPVATSQPSSQPLTSVAPVPTIVQVLPVPTVQVQRSAASSAARLLPVQPATGVDLSRVPSTWLVVGYNARFGSGPGSAGSITVTNRSNKAFAGVAKVSYSRGGVASAAFNNLAPGQSVVLALNGPRYNGGGFQIQVSPR